MGHEGLRYEIIENILTQLPQIFLPILCIMELLSNSIASQGRAISLQMRLLRFLILLLEKDLFMLPMSRK